jgi:hypothetical protein
MELRATRFDGRDSRFVIVKPFCVPADAVGNDLRGFLELLGDDVEMAAGRFAFAFDSCVESFRLRFHFGPDSLELGRHLYVQIVNRHRASILASSFTMRTTRHANRHRFAGRRGVKRRGELHELQCRKRLRSPEFVARERIGRRKRTGRGTDKVLPSVENRPG